ncbi:hypothetical protein I6M38_11630 [Shewanella algae]|uniref:hypothetical protein n=1 Tax=Shewanella algae TaxID=38313 RepID=UPI001AAC5E2A|nr:hypothetical protein [Shewanella algae]MBO2552630.1 hypothetical protein [Shewanella algae]
MDYFDAQLLAGAALGLTEEQTDEIIDGDEDFDTPLIEKFGVDLEQFGDIANALLPLTPLVSSPLTNVSYHAFVRQLGDGNFLAIVKQKAAEQPEKEA